MQSMSHQVRRGRRSYAALVALVAVGTVVAPSARAVTRGLQALRSSVSYCVESAPAAVGIAQARTLLTNAIGAWHGPAGLTSAQALTLTHHNPCATGTAVRLRAAALGSTGPIASANSTSITFNSQYSWWDGIGTRDSWEYSYQGVLTHEMGHTFGIGHGGGPKWSYDNAQPTMTDAGTQATSVDLASLQQDDASMADYVAGGTYRYWSANAGFEDGLAYWTATAGATTSSSYAFSGNRGVRLAGASDSVTITTVYDPYREGTANTVAGNMTATPTFFVRHWTRNPTSGVTRGVSPDYQYRYLQYNTTIQKSAADATATHTSWSAGGSWGSTAIPNTSWWEGSGSVAISNSSTNDATAFKAIIRPWTTDGGAVYFDQLGVTGGMTS